MTAEHVHLCLACRGEARVFAKRLNDEHVVVRFGDYDATVYLDGVDVSAEATEAYAGVHGWVDVFCGHPRHRCERCTYAACQVTKHGGVLVERVRV